MIKEDNRVIFPYKDYLIRDFINLLNKSGTTKRHLINLFIISINMAYYFGVMFAKNENLEKDKQRYKINIMEVEELRDDNKKQKAQLHEKDNKIKELNTVMKKFIL